MTILKSSTFVDMLVMAIANTATMTATMKTRTYKRRETAKH